MKCSYCGNELEKGAEFCPECGMILGLNETREEKNSQKEEPEFKVPEYTPNVFRASDDEEDAQAPAQELEADTSEEIAPIAESIPEFVPEVPEYIPAEITEFEDISSGAQQEEEPEEAEEEIQEEEAKEEEAQEEAQAEQETEILTQEAEEEPVKAPEAAVTYPEYADFAGANQENEVINPTEEEYEEIGADDIYVKPSGKKGPLAFAIVVALICIVIGGAYAVKNFIPVLPSGTEETSDVQAGAVSDTTDAQTTAEEVTTQAAEKETTEAEETEEVTTAAAEDETEATEADEEEEEEITTTKKVTTTKKKETTTKAPSTTKKKVTTTKAPSTTKKQSTTKIPSDSKMQSIRPAYTGAYGINDVPVKQPAKRYSKATIRYCTVEGLVLRARPSSSSDRVLYLSKGADLTVYAKENGFYYVKSNRYGVNGWVSAKYTSKERPEASSGKTYKNTVKPDAKYSKQKTKYTTDGINIRKGPGTKYAAIRIIPIKYPVKVIGYKKGVEGWVYVMDKTYGIYGWVSTKYIK